MLPNLYNSRKGELIISEFAGLNRNIFTQNNEVADCTNISMSAYPFLTTREKRYYYQDENGVALTGGDGISYKEGIIYIESGNLYYCADGSNEFKYVGNGLCEGKKQFVALGAYLLIFPDKKYFWSVMFNHYNDSTDDWFNKHSLKRSPFYGDIDVSVVLNNIRITQCDVYGEEYSFKGHIEYSDNEEREQEIDKLENVCDGDIYLFIDKELNRSYVMQYTSSYYGWVELTTTYTKLSIKASGTVLKNLFKQGDAVEFKNMPSSLSAFNGSYILYLLNENDNFTNIVITGIVNPYEIANIDCNAIYSDADNSVTFNFNEGEGVTICRNIPDMDFVCELDNRIWGCSNDNKEIYASKRGDPFNFNYFAKTPNDSWSLTVGSDGDFTGCTAYLGYILFFKDNCIHRIYGSKPANYQLSTLNVKGVEAGSSDSIMITNETLYYKSRDGIMAYTGAMPENISLKLGPQKIIHAVAGRYKNNYYISVVNVEKNKHELLVIDSNTGFWSKEDYSALYQTINTIDTMYCLSDSDKVLFAMGNCLPEIIISRPDGNNGFINTTYIATVEDDFYWSIESGWINVGYMENKIINKLLIDYEMENKAELSLFYKTDNDSEFTYIETKRNRNNVTVSGVHEIFMKNTRFNRIKYKIEGTGKVLIKAIKLISEVGSDMNGRFN